ncbi:MAG: CRTAC1 family protein [Planctomycetota bacterium]|nr:CRTAC1 family protein [Planctomycetota bacterium]
MTCSRTFLLVSSVLLLAGLPVLLGSCGDEGGSGKGNPAAEGVEADRWKDAPATKMRLRDVTATAGITALNHSGRAGLKEFLIEAVGPGAAWFDYDGDHLLDVYIPDGDVFSNYQLKAVDDPDTGRTRPALVENESRKESFLDSLWRNNGDGTFTDVTTKAGIFDERWSFGATPFDVDADGDQDVFVANYGVNRLWRNNGDGTFTDVAEALGVAGSPFDWSTCAAVGDVDDDGRLDIYVAAYSDPAAEIDRLRVKQGLPAGTPVESISGRDCKWRAIQAYCGPIGLKGQHDTMYRQREDGTFEDVTDRWGLRPRIGKYAFTTLMFDFNDDGLLDIYVANDSEENFMWQQERGADGRILFRDTSDTLGIKVGQQTSAQASMGMSVSDIDQDGRLDIFITNFSHDYNNLYIAKRVGGDGGAVYYKDRGLQTMGQQVYYDLSWGCGWYDFDNDGDLDLYVANGHVYKEIDIFEKTGTSYDQLNAFFENMDARSLAFREVGAKAQRNAPAGADTTKLDAGDGTAVAGCSRQAAFADWNNDGRMDILVMNMNTPPTVLLGEGPAREPDGAASDAGWAKFSFRQAGGNREALGGSFTVETPGLNQRFAINRQQSFLGCDDPRAHVGLGAAQTCSATVVWPGRDRQSTTYAGLTAGRHWILDRESGQATEEALPTFRVP